MQEWSEYVEMLKQAVEPLATATAPVDDQLRSEHMRLMAMGLAQGYFLLFHHDPDYPEFVPFENSGFTCQPNPDAVYYYSAVDGKGTYRVVGERGNSIVLGFATGNRMFGTSDRVGSGFGNYDVDNLTIGPDGKFEVIFSETKPEGYEGDWRYLHPESDFIMLRQFNYHWGRDVDLRMAIERLDPKPPRPRMSPAVTDEKLKRLMLYPKRLAEVALGAIRRVHDGGFVNKFHIHRFEEMGQGADWPQSYFEGVYHIDADEALVLETEIPEEIGYWNVQVIDGLWNQSDILYRQTSLNGATAKLDSDGKFRAVLCATDPGYANWLDTADHQYGMMIGRWYRASSLPVPSLTRMKISEVAGHLGDRSPRITPEQRKADLRERLIGSQLRRKW